MTGNATSRALDVDESVRYLTHKLIRKIVVLEKVFEALASTPRRKILAYLSETALTAGEIAARFEMSKPAISKHLAVLENAGLVTSEKRGQFVWYALVRDNLVNTLNGFVQNVCPVSTPLKKESAAIRLGRKEG